MCRPESLLRPTAQQLTIAPELGVLAALDAVMAMAAYQLAAENPDLGSDALALGRIPDPGARTAARTITRIHDLRLLLREYADVAVGPPAADQPDF